MAMLSTVLIALAPGVFLTSLALLVAWYVKGEVLMVHDGSYQAASHYATGGGLALLILAVAIGWAAGSPAGAAALAAIVVYGLSLAISGLSRRNLARRPGSRAALFATQVIGLALVLAGVAG
jgi:hypothetical protein